MKKIVKIAENEKVKKYIMPLFVTILYFGILFTVYNFTYSEEDAYFSANFSGKYTGVRDPYMIFIKYVLGYFISLFYDICADVNWYCFFMWSFIVISFELVIKRICIICNTFATRLWTIFGYIVFYTLFFLRGYIKFNFSYVAAAVGLVSIFYMVTFRCCTDKMKQSALWIVISTIVCYMVRYEVGLIVVVLSAELSLLILFKYRRQCLKYLLFIWFLIIIGIGFIEIAENIAYSSEELQAELQYRNDRGVVHDYYGYPRYNDAKEIYEKYSISETKAELISNGVYNVTERTNLHNLMHELAVRQTNKHALYSHNEMKGKIFDTWAKIFEYWTSSSYSFINILICISSVFFILLYEVKGEKEEAIFTLIFLLTNGAMWVYLIWRGRINDHAIIPLQSFFGIYILGQILKNINNLAIDDKKKLVISKSITCLIFIYILGYIGIVSYFFSKQMITEANYAEQVLDYANQSQDRIYYTSTYDTSRIMTLHDTKNTSQMLYNTGNLMHPTIRKLLEKNYYYMVADNEKYMVDLLVKALNDEEEQTVKAEQIDTITDGSFQVNIYQFKIQ